MIVAAERFTERYPDYPGRLAFLITSDEEASAVNGTVKVVETLMARHEKVEYCLVGEPSSQSQLGDMIKNGRRGSVTANLTIHGTQAMSPIRIWLITRFTAPRRLYRSWWLNTGTTAISFSRRPACR